MKRSGIIFVAAFLLFATALGQMTGKEQQTGEEQELLGAERAWADAFACPDGVAFDEILAAEFSFKGPGGVVAGKSDFIVAARNASGTYRIVRLDEQSARSDGETVVTSGHVIVRERGPKAAPQQVKGETVVATKSAVVNMAELAREEAARPPSSEPERHVAIHPPMSIPDGEATSGDGAPATEKQYRYTVTYVRRSGRWQAVSLRLTPFP